MDATKVKSITPKMQELIDILEPFDTVKQDIILEKIKLFTKSDVKNLSSDGNGHFIPKFKQMDIVHCDFTGVGFEWDGPHYALVWDVNPRFDSILVIPTTSQRRKNLHSVINVGKISGLPNNKDTTLLISDMTRVSRKRLEELTYQHPKKGKQNVRLPQPWKTKIIESITTTYTNEITFEEFLINKCGMDMLVDTVVLEKLRYKPVKASYDKTNKTLSFRIWNEENYHTLKLNSPKNEISREQRRQIILDLNSDLAEEKRAALLSLPSFY